MRGRFLLGVWVSFFVGFVILAAFASIYDRFPGDVWLAERLQEIDHIAFEAALDRAEDVGDIPWILVPWLGGAGALLVSGRWRDAVLLLASAIGRPINGAIKELVERPRPSEDLVLVREHPGSFSFPSGHADAVIVVYGLLFLFITLYVRHPGVRLLGQAACLWVIVFTGMERVWMGAHWPSDVLGGYYLGGLILAAIIAAQRSWPRRRTSQ